MIRDRVASSVWAHVQVVIIHVTQVTLHSCLVLQVIMYPTKIIMCALTFPCPFPATLHGMVSCEPQYVYVTYFNVMCEPYHTNSFNPFLDGEKNGVKNVTWKPSFSLESLTMCCRWSRRPALFALVYYSGFPPWRCRPSSRPRSHRFSRSQSSRQELEQPLISLGASSLRLSTKIQRNYIFTASKRSRGKVVFSRAYVRQSFSPRGRGGGLG